MATREQKQQWLAEAEQALHEIRLGRGVRTIVDQSGERVEYTLASAPALAAYIEQLKRDLGETAYGPMVFWL